MCEKLKKLSCRKPNMERQSNCIELKEMSEIKDSLDKAYGFSKPQKDGSMFRSSSLKCKKNRGRQPSLRSCKGARRFENF